MDLGGFDAKFFWSFFGNCCKNSRLSPIPGVSVSTPNPSGKILHPFPYLHVLKRDLSLSTMLIYLFEQNHPNSSHLILSDINIRNHLFVNCRIWWLESWSYIPNRQRCMYLLTDCNVILVKYISRSEPILYEKFVTIFLGRRINAFYFTI